MFLVRYIYEPYNMMRLIYEKKIRSLFWVCDADQQTLVN